MVFSNEAVFLSEGDMMIFCRIFLSLLLFFSVYSCSSQQELTVSAAMSLKDAFTELSKLFQKKFSDYILRVNFASSGSLARQIEAGAPVDLFASASKKHMDRLQKKKMVVQKSRFDFASNRIAFVVPNRSKFKFSSLREFNGSKLLKVAIGNPKSVPAGRYAFEAIKRLKLFPYYKRKLIFGEHVRQVLDYVVRGEVDAGMVYATDYSLRKNKIKLLCFLPAKSHTPIMYPIAMLHGASCQSGARKFLQLLSSGKGRAILNKYGFIAIKRHRP